MGPPKLHYLSAADIRIERREYKDEIWGVRRSSGIPELSNVSENPATHKCTNIDYKPNDY